MEPTLSILVTSAVTVGFIHTLIGIDHTLPFVALGRAQRWPLRRVLALTLACGIAHVASSVVIGGLGLGLGVAVAKLQWLEAIRGSASAWVLIVFGTLYAGWSFARERRGHGHAHVHANGIAHTHPDGERDHDHPDAVRAPDARVITAWSLFIIFVLGPCEPLIPLLMAPALDMGVAAAVPVVIAFSITTVGTMLVLVTLGHYGLRLRSMQRLEAYVGTLAGVAIAVSGIAIQLFGI